MAWIEQTRSRYRVRYRYHSVIYTDSAHADATIAVERRDIFEAGARRRARLFGKLNGAGGVNTLHVPTNDGPCVLVARRVARARFIPAT
jgi:hypothetical protein